MGLRLFQGIVVGVAFMVSAADTQTDSRIPSGMKGEKLRMHETDLAMGGTLIGALSFMMVLYWATNWDDMDILKNTWTIIGTTMSIFCAVLMFQEFHHLVHNYFTIPLFGDEVTVPVFLVTFAHFWFWVIVTLVLFMCQLIYVFHHYNTKDIDQETVKKEMASLRTKDTLKEYNDEKYYHRGLGDVKCITELSGHLVGFASINTFATLQRLDFFRHSVITASAAIVVATIALILMLGATMWLRNFITHHLSRHWLKESLAGDRYHKFHAFWSHEMKDAENDVVTLTVSFLIMQCIRFHITGCLPNEEGIEEEDCSVTIYDHTLNEKASIFSVQLVSMLIAFLIVAFQTPAKEKEKKKEEAKEDQLNQALLKDKTLSGELWYEEQWERLSEICIMGCAMLFAWSLYYGSQMILAGFPCFNMFPGVEHKGENMLLAVATAIFVSAGGFVSLLALDFFADRVEDLMDWIRKIANKAPDRKRLEKIDYSKYSQHLERASRKLMSAVGIAIGISWEKCFDGSVIAISDMGGNGWFGEGLRFFLCMYCVCLLVPSWRWYVKPFLTSKGWLFGYMINIPQLHKKAFQKCDDEMHLYKLNKVTTLATQLIHTLNTKSEISSDTCEKSPTVESLTLENRYLQTQVQNYRNMFVDHMNGMGATLENMSHAMDRL